MKTIENPVFSPRIEVPDTLNMPEWIQVGRELQHPDFAGKAVPMVVRMGLDFGTAFTKVAVRAGVDLVCIDWSFITGDTFQEGRYLMPSLIVHSSAGGFSWRRLPESDICTNLKLPLIDANNSNECPVAAVAYLALVIRYARAYLFQHTDVGRILSTRSLRWELNIGCPTKPYDDKVIVKFFKRISRTAWQLAAQDNLQESNIISTWKNDQSESSLETEPSVVPEFVAQIAGYLDSSQKREDLHALIDIGAATLDVATFNLVFHENISPTTRIPIFFSNVSKLGTHYLNQNRHTRLGIDPAWDDTTPVEQADCFSSRNGIPVSQVVAADKIFLNKVSDCITKVLHATRVSGKGHPRSSAWKEGGLPIFVTGGGANCDLYRQAVNIAGQELKRRSSLLDRFRLIELNPQGTNITTLNNESASRMTVAIGLTSDADSIARIVRSSDIQPIPTSKGKRKKADHADLYSD